MNAVKYPDIHVQLTDGNAFAVLGAVKGALKRGGAPHADIEAFIEEATAGDYNHLLATAMEWVDVR